LNGIFVRNKSEVCYKSFGALCKKTKHLSKHMSAVKMLKD